MAKRYLLYMIRWQLSTPILALVLSLLHNANPWIGAMIANFIGAMIFIHVDRLILVPGASQKLIERLKKRFKKEE